MENEKEVFVPPFLFKARESYIFDQPMITPEDINRNYGAIDLFLLDQLLKKNIKTGRLLDAGCGEGRNLKYFAKAPEYDVYGIDIYDAALEMARLVYKKTATFQNFSISEMPYPQDYFNTILCINVLHHLESSDQWMRTMESLRLMLKQGGVLFIRTLVSAEEHHIRRGNYLITSIPFLNRYAHEKNLVFIEPIRREVNEANDELGAIIIQKS